MHRLDELLNPKTDSLGPKYLRVRCKLRFELSIAELLPEQYRDSADEYERGCVLMSLDGCQLWVFTGPFRLSTVFGPPKEVQEKRFGQAPIPWMFGLTLALPGLTL